MARKLIAGIVLLLPQLTLAASLSGTIIKEQREGAVALNVKTASGEVVELWCPDITPACAGLIEEVPGADAERISRRLMGKRVTVQYELEPNKGRVYADENATIHVLKKIVFEKTGKKAK